MTADTLKQFTTDALDRLATLLDTGQSDQFTALLKAMARFHRYSFHNVCLIVAQRPAATRVAGFHTWRSLGRFVRKGEKGIVILAPIVTRRRCDDTDDETWPASERRTCSTSRRRTASRCPSHRPLLAILATARLLCVPRS